MIKIKHLVLVLLLTTSAFFASPLMAADGTKKTVKEVLSENSKLSGIKVIVTGKVIKVNNGIMKRNFLHIQDGTSLNGADKVIVTSKQTATVGQQVTVTGTVVLDTDFGFGYKYPLLIEKSTIVVNK